MLCDRISLLRRCVVDVAAIDQMNILQAALRAMEGAVTALPCSPPDYLLVDGNQLPGAFRKDSSQTVVRGDSKSTVIAAASILAKVWAEPPAICLMQEPQRLELNGKCYICRPELCYIIRMQWGCAG